MKTLLPAKTLVAKILAAKTLVAALALTLGWLSQVFALPLPQDAGATTQAPPEDTTDAAKILLERARTRYQSTQTYRDRMRIASFMVVDDGKPKPMQQLVAETRLDRKGGCLWRYERVGHAGGAMPYVVWSREGELWSSYWAIQKKVEEFGPNAELAFAGPTGVSCNATNIVLPLLLQRNGRPRFGSSVLELTGATVGTRENIAGIECETVSGTGGGDRAFTLWIDANGILRKVRLTMTVDPAKVADRAVDARGAAVLERMREKKRWTSVTEFEIEPVFDAPIAAEELDFKPPAPAGRPAEKPDETVG